MSTSRSASNAYLARLLSSIALVPPLAAAALSPAAAQQVLPGILVEGATLEAPPARRPRPAAAASSPGTATQVPAEEAEASGAPDEEAGIPAARLGTSVTVVTGEDLQRQQVRHAADALRSLPGVSVSRTGSPAGLTQVRLRGAEANHTLVLIDGVEANAGSDGTFDFSDLLTEDIERIEVIRGPQSALYGSNAVGGVINVITKSGKGPLRVASRIEGGSFGTKEGAARISGGTDRVWGSVTVQHRRSDGFNIAPEGALGEEDGNRLTSFSARAGAMLADNVRLDLGLRRVEKRGDRDDQTAFDTRDGFIIASDSFSHFNSTVLLMGADLRWDMLGGDLTHVFKATRNVTTRDDVQIADFDEVGDGSGFGNGFGPPSPFENTDEAYKLAYQATYRFATPGLMARHSVTGLVEREREAFKTRSDFGSANAARSQTAFAGEWRGEFLDRVFLSAGLRHDDNDSFNDFTTWRTGISVPIPEIGVRPHASAGTGVKAPTLIEQFGTTANFVSNPGLEPEESLGWDAGVELTFLAGRAVVDVTYFSADLKNKIRTEFISMFDPGRIIDCNPGDLFCSYPINLDGKAKRKGVEIASRLQVLPNLSLGLAYTYLDAVEEGGAREIRRPPHSARADVTYGFDEGRGLFQLAAVYNGEADDEAFGAPFFSPVVRLALDDYWLVSAAASYKVQPGLEIYGRVENLFDESYEEIFGYDTAGIAAYAGLRLTLEDGRLATGVK
ncbi:MAG: TonB-dependent receptor [Hyphomicrobiaceae bacterium]|nr:TonB-dependent receptor [Hyphomicrobiaceae bacterium]